MPANTIAPLAFASPSLGTYSPSSEAATRETDRCCSEPPWTALAIKLHSSLKSKINCSQEHPGEMYAVSRQLGTHVGQLSIHKAVYKSQKKSMAKRRLVTPAPYVVSDGQKKMLNNYNGEEGDINILALSSCCDLRLCRVDYH